MVYKKFESYHFILVINRSSSFEQVSDDFSVTFGGGALKSSVTGLENKGTFIINLFKIYPGLTIGLHLTKVVLNS